MTLSKRAEVLRELSAAISSIARPHPVRVAIDGRTASGKTTLANELADALAAEGRNVIRTSIDGFHRPKIERYARGRHSPEGYYYDARDFAAINALLLVPLGPDGDLAYRTASFDLHNDMPIEQESKLAARQSILVVDGTFLQRPELANGWDLTIFVETAETVSEQRGISRDTALLGGEDAARQIYEARYKPAYKLYESICAPATNADAVINNDDFNNPVLTIRANGRLAPDLRNRDR